jgi:hypothetical protein
VSSREASPLSKPSTGTKARHGRSLDPIDRSDLLLATNAHLDTGRAGSDRRMPWRVDGHWPGEVKPEYYGILLFGPSPVLADGSSQPRHPALTGFRTSCKQLSRDSASMPALLSWHRSGHLAAVTRVGVEE